MAESAKPLYKLPFGNGRKRHVKSGLIHSPMLCMYQLNLLRILASNYGVGAAISHIHPDLKERPIAYARRIRNKHEINCSQIAITRDILQVLTTAYEQSLTQAPPHL